ncbi:MAG: AraC family transcriptional regulator [Sphingomonadales bacterium]
MLLPLSEPVPLLPGMAAKVEHVRQAADTPVPQPFLHFHGPAELVLIEAGTGQFLCEGSQHRLAPGTIVYAPAMAIHDFAFDSGARAWTLIQFDPHALDRQTIALPAAPRSCVLDPESLPRINMLAHWLAQSIDDRVPQSAVVVQLAALVLATLQAFGPDLASGMPAPSSLSKFRPLLNQLDGDPALTLRLDAAATLCAMSPSYFSRCFKQAFGIGFIAYQSRLKLQQAARMIATGGEPVSQIAYRLGFRSHAYFSHCFKAVFGVSPSQLRGQG